MGGEHPAVAMHKTEFGIGHLPRLCLMAQLANRRFDLLSSGERMLVLIARSVVKKPKLLILDEPCQGLDPARREKILDLVDAVAVESALSVIFVTHRSDELPGCITHTLDIAIASHYAEAGI